MVRDRHLSVADEMWLRDEAPQEYIDDWYQHYLKYPPMVTLHGIGFGVLISSVINFAKSWGKGSSPATQPGDIFPFLTKEGKNENQQSHMGDMLEMMAERPT